MNRALRLMQIRDLLQGRGYTTAELAEKYGISERSILHDLSDLQGEPFYLPLEEIREKVWRLVKVEGGAGAEAR